MPRTDEPSGRVPDRDQLVVLATAMLLGVVVALGFEAFETLSHELRHLVWERWGGEDPSPFVTLAVAGLGGTVVGVAIRFVPGQGGPHPGDVAEGHDLLGAGRAPMRVLAGIVVVGFVALVAGASLGPEGALLPATAGLGMAAGRRLGLSPAMHQALAGASLASLVATMFGSPLAGVVPLLELLPAAGSVAMVVLPSLVASATAVLTLQVIDAEPAGFLALGYEGFARGDVVWAVLVGVVAGAVVVRFDTLVHIMRRVTLRLDARGVVLTTTVGGLVLGLLYVVGGDEVRFTGIPELALLVDSDATTTAAALAVVTKVLATAWCLAIGYRGGIIFPLAFVGGATGLTLHLLVGAIPVGVALGAGIGGAVAVGMKSPITAGLIVAAVVGPELLPLALIGVVAAHAVHLLAAGSPQPPAVEVDPAG